MPQGKIYSSEKMALYDLLDLGAQEGAKLLIPDIQRPFTWKPKSITMLVDSLIRGWPFGTLLLWRVRSTDSIQVPHRGFWKVYDEKDLDGAQAATKAQAPETYLMVLDGQQRLQSLLLAVGDGKCGYRWPDSDWADHLEQRRPRGGAKQWSLGQLCLDLEEFAAQYDTPTVGQDVASIDYTKALCWVIWDSAEGMSKDRPAKYEPPLPTAFDKAGKLTGRFVRLSKLWRMARTDGVAEAKYRQELEKELPSFGVHPERVQALKSMLAEFLAKLGTVKGTEVSYLELQPYQGEVGDTQELDRYEDAVVNIFTRLNKAGTPLTDQEITFAWIKQQWDTKRTGGRNAAKCFEELRSELREHSVNLDMDDLVASVATLWSVLDNKGETLRPQDLLKPKVLKPMASHLDRRWDVLSQNAVRIAEALADLRLVYRKHFESLYALNVLWAWRLLPVEWANASRQGPVKLTTVATDNHRKAVDQMFGELAPRWIAMTHWGGTWRGKPRESFSRYLRELNALWDEVRPLTSPDEVQKRVRDLMQGWLEELRGQCIEAIDAMGVDRREDVRRYYLALWVWHRLDKQRWKDSEIPLRTKSRAGDRYDVDHVIAYKLWERTLDFPATNSAESASAQDSHQPADKNELGNMLLMEKNFNIAKTDKPLAQFLDEVFEFRSENPKRYDMQEWAKSLLIEPPHLNPVLKNGGVGEVYAIHKAVTVRTTRMKHELKEFVEGKREIVAEI